MPHFYVVLVGCNKLTPKIAFVSDTRESLLVGVNLKLGYDFTQYLVGEEDDVFVHPELPDNYSTEQYQLPASDWQHLYGNANGGCACGVNNLYIVGSTAPCDDVDDMMKEFERIQC